MKMTEAKIEVETQVKTDKKRSYTKGPTRRFAIQFPLNLPGYCRVQTSKDNISVYEIKKMKPLYQLGMADTLAIARFLVLHDLAESAADLSDDCQHNTIYILEQGNDIPAPVKEWLIDNG